MITLIIFVVKKKTEYGAKSKILFILESLNTYI